MNAITQVKDNGRIQLDQTMTQVGLNAVCGQSISLCYQNDTWKSVLDDRNCIIIPDEQLKKFHLTDGTAVQLTCNDNTIIINPASPWEHNADPDSNILCSIRKDGTDIQIIQQNVDDGTGTVDYAVQVNDHKGLHTVQHIKYGHRGEPDFNLKKLQDQTLAKLYNTTQNTLDNARRKLEQYQSLLDIITILRSM